MCVCLTAIVTCPKYHTISLLKRKGREKERISWEEEDMRSDSMYAAKLALFSLLLPLPLLLVISDGVDTHIQKFNSHSHSHMHNVDPSLVVFFFLDDLKLGNTMLTYFPTPESSSHSLPSLLSKQEADSIPFSLQQFPHILRLLSISPHSPQAKAMEEALQQCEGDPIEGEIKTCATSWESMTQFLHTIFGADTPIESVTTTHLKRSNHDTVQKYEIMGIKQIPSPKMVGCHTMSYAYTIFYCHHQADSETRVYRVALKGENGDEVDAAAVCHMDTSHWPPTHDSFQMLGVEPGSTPVCHFFPPDHFVWLPAA